MSRAVFLLVLIFSALPRLVSQNSAGDRPNEGDYFVRMGEGGPEIIQRLSWPEDGNAFRYEAVIEREEQGEFREVYRDYTPDAFVEVSLRPGNYRYYVRIFNMLNQYEYATNRASFSVILALQPVLRRFTPGRLYLEDCLSREVELQGENFEEGAVVYLEPLTEEGEPVFAREYAADASGKRARMVFDPQELAKGDYRLVIKNPGGLSDSGDPLRVKGVRPQFGLSLSYAPLVPLHGYLFDLFDGGFYPIGAALRAEGTFLKTKWGYLGAELSLSWNYLSVQKNNVDITAHVADLEVNLLYRKQLLPMVFNFYAGFGLGGIFLLEFDYRIVKSDPYNTVGPLFDLGASFQWYFTRRLYGELGVQYAYLLTKDTVRPGYLRPSLGLGWRF
jgi:hypothetical protein